MGDEIITTQDIKHDTRECNILLAKGTYAYICEVWNDKNVLLEVPSLYYYGANCLIDANVDQIEFFDKNKYLSQFNVGSKVKTLAEINLTGKNCIVPIGTNAIINSINKGKFKANIQIVYEGYDFDMDFNLIDLSLVSEQQTKVIDKLNYDYHVGDKIKVIYPDSIHFTDNIDIQRGTEGTITDVQFEYVDFDILYNNEIKHLSAWVDDVCKSEKFKDFYENDSVITLVDKTIKTNNGNKLYKKGSVGLIDSLSNYPKIMVEFYDTFSFGTKIEYLPNEIKYQKPKRN